MPQILVIGSANVDFTIRVKRLPRPGETLIGSDLALAFGGKGANQAVAAARLGGTVVFAGALGSDDLGTRYLKYLRGEHINTQSLRQAADAPTGCAQILVEEGGQNMIVVSPGANRLVLPGDVEAAFERGGDVAAVALQLEIPLESVCRAIQIANRKRIPVLLNPSPYNPALSLSGLRVDYLIVNEVEARQMSGLKTTDTSDSDIAWLESAVARLGKLGAERVIVTRGAESTFVCEGGKTSMVPTVAVKPVDTVGAGDTFAGALAVAIGEGRELLEAVRFANCAAALATLQPGAQTSMPRRAEVEKMEGIH
ncbi:MAG: ribokinase [Candidatus Sumerlaeota bacterium]|nr:ribokinase [Candidatus Sumerlaeota bacterium]